MLLTEPRHCRTLLHVLILSKVAFLVLLLLSDKYLPAFDSSHHLVSLNPLLRPFIRWDVFHFIHMASQGYVYEHEWAFFPGVPFLMSLGGKSDSAVIFAGSLAAVLCDSTRVFYHLSLHHLRNPNLAFLATVLALLPTSPVTLYFAPYNEPFFTYLSYRGMLFCTRKQWLFASISFGLAGLFRSNAIFMAGFVIWGVLVVPFVERKQVLIKDVIKAVLLFAVVIFPFIYHERSAFGVFCLGEPHNSPLWCTKIPPSIYTYVQSKYWDVGLFRYWRLSQMPNFILAAPTLVLITAFALNYLSSIFPNLTTESPRSSSSLSSHFLNPSIAPHAIHALFISSILLFASHTQIVLRLAASLPLTYWAAAWVVVKYPAYGSCWVTWSLIWGVVSIILWSSFLPPA